MLAVGLSEAEALEWITERADVCIAAVNSPSGVTLAGTHSAIAELSEELTDPGVFARQLRVEVPYHSHLMDPVLPELTRALADLAPRTPIVPLYSTVTSSQVTGPDWDAEYWCANVREPVRFADAMTAVIDNGERVFLEVGPHPALSGNIKEILLRKGATGTSISTLNRQADDRTSMRTALADLYVAGALDTDHAPGASDGLPPHRPLPAHRFQRMRLWSMEQPVIDGYLGTSDARALPGDQMTPVSRNGGPSWRPLDCPGCATTSSPTWWCCPGRPTSMPRSPWRLRPPVVQPRRWTTSSSSPRSWWKTTTSQLCAWHWSPLAGGSQSARDAVRPPAGLDTRVAALWTA